MNFSVVIFNPLLKDNIQRQSVLCWAVTNMQKYYLKFWDAYFFFIIMKLKCFVHTFWNCIGSCQSGFKYVNRFVMCSKRISTTFKGHSWWEHKNKKKKRNGCICSFAQLKQARLKSGEKQKWHRLQVLPYSLDKNIREYLCERYALITAKRFHSRLRQALGHYRWAKTANEKRKARELRESEWLKNGGKGEGESL